MPKENPENYKRQIEENIVQTVREPLIVLDADLRVISANKSFYRSFKVNPKETKGRLIYDLGNRQWNIPKLRKLLEEILPKNTSFNNYEVEHDFPHIGRRIMLLNARRIPRPPAKPRIMLLAFEDVTERRKVEGETLREEGERWNSLMKNSNDVIMIVNGQGIIQYINRTLPHYSPEKTIGKSVYEFMIKDQRDVIRKSLKKVFKTGEPGSFEMSSNIPKIGTKWFSTKVVPIKQDKVVKKIIMISTDITERKRAEEQAQISKIHLSYLTKYANDLIILLDDKFRFLETNERVIDSYGYTREELIGMHATQLRAPETKALFAEQVKPVYVKGKAVYETVHQRKDGIKFPVEISLRAINTDEKRFYQAIIRDITERKKGENELRSSEEKFKAIFDNANDGMALADNETKKFYSCNNKFREMLGFSPEEINKLGVADIHPKGDLPYVLAQFERQARREVGVAKDIPVKRKDGGVFYADISSAPVTLAARTFILGIFRDVTERKKVEDSLRESEKRLHDILMSSADFIWEVDKNGKYTFVSGNVKKILGYEPEELIGKTPFDLMEREEAERTGKIFQQIASQRKPVVDMENWNIRKDGKKACILTNGVPIVDEKGDLIGYRGVDKDITDRKIKEEELKKKTDESDRFSKLSVGRELRMVELKKRIRDLENIQKGGGTKPNASDKNNEAGDLDGK